MAKVTLRIEKKPKTGKGHYYLEYYYGSKVINGVQKVESSCHSKMFQLLSFYLD